ncbi:uncharacterized protein si:dkey-33c12.4 isoform X2 [Antennarius striatus]|uniref:uncharacterized protein si:dkey-33c12.4 isoform X2 n=1 Tax=Antennarius striatus TaxID=241820 RepID=UPI0035ADA742
MDTEYDAIIQSFERLPAPAPSGIQRMIELGILAHIGCGDDLDFSDEDDYGYGHCTHGHSSFHGYRRISHRRRNGGLHESRGLQPAFTYQLPPHYWSGFCDVPHSRITFEEKETDAERNARLKEEAAKSKEKARKKRLKKQKQKERKQLEKLKKEQENPVKSEETPKDGECEVHDATPSSVSAKDTDSSDGLEDEASDEDDTEIICDDPELDMTSTFVSKAADIAKRKLEQRAKSERRNKTKIPDKEAETIPENPKEVEVEEKDSAAPSLQDNVKISTELASVGNRFASTGDFNMAVKYFTDAIKYNPTEFKLFGNRSYCFERMREYAKALTDAELSLNMCPGWVKGLFRKGRALAGLKRYEEAAQAFSDVLKFDASCAEAAQELMRVQITQLMEHGFSREQSANALIIHGTVKKALEVLCRLNSQSVVQNGTLPPAQLVNASGVSPVLSANIKPPLPQSRNAVETQFKNNSAGPVQIVSDVKSQPKPNRPPQDLFPIWVGNLLPSVTETTLTNLFTKVGLVHSMKVLTHKRCAFINFKQKEHCEEAIRGFHGFMLNGTKIAVRYPDRIPPGMGISRSALTSDDLEDVGRSAAGSWRPVQPSQRPSYPREDS